MKHCDDTSRGCADSGGYACHCYCDLCRAAQGDPDASRIIALESRAAELEAALRALVEAQSGCRAYRDHGSMLSGVTCGAVATVHGPGNSSKFCDEHKAEWMSELPQAQAVRAALLLLAKGG